MVVRHGETVLFQSDSAKGRRGWRTDGGKWGVADGALRQTSEQGCCLALAGDPSWTDYTLTLKARKISGREGFLILVHRGDGCHTWCNLGGWGNSSTGLEQQMDGDKQDVGPHSDFNVETGRWYDLRIEAQGTHLKAFADNRLVAEGDERPGQP